MGKGSGRRPSQISEEQYTTNYDRTFRGEQVEAPPACPAIHLIEPGDYRVRCQITEPHRIHGAVFDGVGVTWLDPATP